MTDAAMLTCQLRMMRLEDVEQVQAIDRVSFSLPWPESAYRYELTQNPASLAMVAEAQIPESGTQIVGMIVVWLILDEAHIATLATHPDYRRQGIARRLLAAALLECISRGTDHALLEVRQSNQEAQQLYQDFGFEVAGRRKRYYRDNYEDALLMTAAGFTPAYQGWLESQASGGHDSWQADRL